MRNKYYLTGNVIKTMMPLNKSSPNLILALCQQAGLSKHILGSHDINLEALYINTTTFLNYVTQPINTVHNSSSLLQ